MTDQNNILQVSGLTKRFGGLTAVNGVDFTVRRGELLGLIGPNGAGKTTLFNLLMGLTVPSEGDILLEGQSIKGLKPHQVCQRGMVKTFQNVALFPDLTVLDNVRLAGQVRNSRGLLDTVLRTRGYHQEENGLREKALNLLEIFELQDRAEELASNLSYGHQRKLEIIRALATDPKVLLLDEPAAGLNPQEKRMLAHSIQQIRDRFQVAVLLIEHDMPLVMEICERIVVLDHGVTICEGVPSEIQNDPRVIADYLGGGLEEN